MVLPTRIRVLTSGQGLGLEAPATSARGVAARGGLTYQRNSTEMRQESQPGSSTAANGRDGAAGKQCQRGRLGNLCVTKHLRLAVEIGRNLEPLVAVK